MPKFLEWYKRAETCNNSILQMRSSIFLPVGKTSRSYFAKEFKKNKYIVAYDGNDYKIKVHRVLLTQEHRDIIDIILNKSGTIETKIGKIVGAKISKYEIQKKLGLSMKSKNAKWIEEKIIDLQSVVIDTFDKKTEKGFRTNIIKSVHDKLNEYIIFCPEYLVFFTTSDIAVNYKKHIYNIISIKSAVVKSLVRYCLSHNFKSELHMPLELILATTGIRKENMGIRNYQRILKNIKDSKYDLKNKFNIEISNNMVFYKTLDQIKFYYPNHEQKKINKEKLFKEIKPLGLL